MIFSKLSGYCVFYQRRRTPVFLCLVLTITGSSGYLSQPFNRYLRGGTCDSLPGVMMITCEQKSGFPRNLTCQKKKGSYTNCSRPYQLRRLFKIIKLLILCVKNVCPCKYALKKLDPYRTAQTCLDQHLR